MTVTGKILAADIAAPFRNEVKTQVAKLLSEHGVQPLLVGFLANGDQAARKYAEWTKKACEADGISFELRECSQVSLAEELKNANNDEKVHGIMIYYPCFGAVPSFFGGKMDDHLRDSVAVEKDVEGLCYTYRRSLYHNQRFLKTLKGDDTDKKCLLPCTPLAIVKALEYLNAYDQNLPVGERLKGQTVTVVNRSEVVGRPLSAMLANDGAEVFSVDIDSIYLMKRGQMLDTELDAEQACRRSQIIVTGVPVKSYKLNTEWIQPGTIVINVSHFKNVDPEAVLKIPEAKYISPIGKVTVSMLERNLLRLVKNFHTPGNKASVVEAGGRVVGA